MFRHDETTENDSFKDSATKNDVIQVAVFTTNMTSFLPMKF